MNSSNETIAAISTPLGRGGIGIIRLSGPDSINFAGLLFKSKDKLPLAELPSHRITYGHLLDPETGVMIDEAIVTIMRAPRSYTREDVVEINCHAGTIVLKAGLEAALRAGARLAEPGEFTKRAFLNGRIDLAQAEAVSDLINSRTKSAARVAIQQMAGAFSEKIGRLRQELLSLLAQLEAAVDFSDEDIETPGSAAVNARVCDAQQRIESLLETSRFGKILTNGLETAIVGRANVGKSSLLNALVQEERAIVTPIPGTTRDVIEVAVNVNGVPVKFKDTAGFRIPQDEAEAAGIAFSRKAAELADLVLMVVDGTEALSDEDINIVEQIKYKPVILVVNKFDLPAGLEADEILKLLSAHSSVETSTISGHGLDELRQSISDFVHDGDSIDADTIVVNVRHEQALEKARDRLIEMTEAIENGFTEEVQAQILKDAIDALGEIIGASNYEDLLDEIFSQFCLGK